MAGDLTVEILKQIRDGVLGTNERVDGLKQEMAEVKQELVGVNGRLGRVEQELVGVNGRLGRVEQGLLDLGGFMRTIARDLAKQERWHNEHVRVLEKDMSSLKTRVGKLEKKKGA